MAREEEPAAAAPGEEWTDSSGYGRELAALKALIDVTSAALSLPTVLETALESATGLLELPLGLIWLWDPAGRLLRIAAGRRVEGISPEIRHDIPEHEYASWLCGRVFSGQAPVFVSDLRADPAYADTRAVQYGVAAVAAVPLTAREQPLGVLLLGSTSPRPFSAADRRILVTIAREVAVAIANAQSYAQLQQQTATLRALLATTRELGSTLELRQLLQVIAQQAQALIGVDSCFISLLNPETGILTPVVALHDWADQVLAMRIKLGQGVTGHAALTGVGEIVNRADLDPRAATVPGTPDKPESLLVSPLKHMGQVIGVMTLSRLDERQFQPPDLELADAFAAQAAVAVQNARLYTQSAQRARELEQAQARLLKVQNQLLQAEKLSAIGQLAAGMAHELNNPLTAIMGFAQLLEGEALSPTGRSDVRRILGGAARAQKIVANLLAFARQQQVSPEPVDVAALIERILRLHADELKSGGVTVRQELEDLPELRLDPFQVEQLVLRLLRHAHRAMETSGGTLSVSLSQPGPGRMRLEVADEGPGIAPDFLPHLFDPFFTSDDTDEGLELSACLGIVRAHRGRLWAEPGPGRGTRLIAELPLDTGAAEATPATMRRSMLIVTGDDALAESLTAIVERMGHRASRVESGEAALAEVVVRRYDLILCGAALPGMSRERLYESVAASDAGLAGRFVAVGDGGPDLEEVPSIALPLEAARVQQALAAHLDGHSPPA